VSSRLLRRLPPQDNKRHVLNEHHEPQPRLTFLLLT